MNFVEVGMSGAGFRLSKKTLSSVKKYNFYLCAFKFLDCISERTIIVQTLRFRQKFPEF